MSGLVTDPAGREAILFPDGIGDSNGVGGHMLKVIDLLDHAGVADVAVRLAGAVSSAAVPTTNGDPDRRDDVLG